MKRSEMAVRRYVLLWFVILLFLTVPAVAATLDGFVTNVTSSTTFDVGVLHVSLNGRTSCEARMSYALKARVYPFGHIQAAIVSHQRSRDTTIIPMQCVTLPLVIGSRLHLVGMMQKQSLLFTATQAAVYVEAPTKSLEGAALIEEAPEITKDSTGTLWINGYPTRITPQTKIFPAPATTAIRYSVHFDGTIGMHATEQSATPLSIKSLSTNMWVTYHATRAADGSVTATQLRFWPNQVDADEANYLKTFAAVIDAPDYRKHISGSIRFKHGEAIKSLPDQAVQDYVFTLGMEMVPQYQKELSDTDATKVRFRFCVVQPFIATDGNQFVSIDGVLPHVGRLKYTYDSIKSAEAIESIVAMPDGLILVPDSLLDHLQTKAQLASLLSYAITSILQKQAYLAWPTITSPRAKRTYMLVDNNNPFIYMFGYWQNTQMLKIGVRGTQLAGYDIREAPFAWAAAQGKPISTPVIDSKYPDKEIPWYATYAFNYISQYYKDVDYSKLKRGEKEYQQFLQELYKADPSLPQPKAQ